MEENENEYMEMEPPSDLKGRPIIAGPTSPTNHISELIQKIISPLLFFNHMLKMIGTLLENYPETLANYFVATLKVAMRGGGGGGCAGC